MSSKSKSRTRAVVRETPRGWANYTEAAIYAGVSPKIVSDWVDQGLRSVEMNHKTKLIKLEWIDEFLINFKPTGKPDLKALCKKAMGQN